MVVRYLVLLLTLSPRDAGVFLSPLTDLLILLWAGVFWETSVITLASVANMFLMLSELSDGVEA